MRKGFKVLENHDIRALVDDRSEKVGKKIRDAELEKFPYMLILGENEANEGTVSVRRQGEATWRHEHRGIRGAHSLGDCGDVEMTEVSLKLKRYSD